MKVKVKKVVLLAPKTYAKCDECGRSLDALCTSNYVVIEDSRGDELYTCFTCAEELMKVV